MAVVVHRSIRPSTFLNSRRFFPSMIPFQPLLYTSHVVTHGSWPTFVNNPSVLDDVKADGKSTVSDVCCVKHRIYHHRTSGYFSRHLTCCTTSFGLRSVGSDFVVILWNEVRGNLIKALKRFVVSNAWCKMNQFRGTLSRYWCSYAAGLAKSSRNREIFLLSYTPLGVWRVILVTAK